MTLQNSTRNLVRTMQSRRPMQRIAQHPGSTNSPSEQAIRSISAEFRSTPRW